MVESAAPEIREPAQEPLRAIASAISGGVLLARAERICWASDRLTEMAGFAAAADLTDLPLGALFSDNGDGIPGPNARAVVECGLKRSDGSIRSVGCRSLHGAALAEHTAAWVIEDLTHIRSVERELLHLGRDLHGANRELADLRDRLRRENNEREELLTVVSHELRTPVTIISGYNRLLLAEKVGPLNDEQRGFLSESSKACRRLDLFIGNLLEASRQDAGSEILEITHASVAGVVDEVVGLLRPLLDDAKLAIRVDIAEDADRARFDRTRLEQILINLIGNAVKFSPPGGAIEISTRAISQASEQGAERTFVEFRVSDQGPGVAPAHRQRIFEPYVQVGEQRGAGGLGLGLAICRRLVAAHGGAICVEARPTGGSCFVFTIPASSAVRTSGAGGVG